MAKKRLCPCRAVVGRDRFARAEGNESRMLTVQGESKTSINQHHFLPQLDQLFSSQERDCMKGYIKNKTIVLIDSLPENLQDGDEVEVFITPTTKPPLPFPTFNLGIKDEYLDRDRIYEQDSNSV